MCGRSLSLRPRCSPPGSGRGSGSGMWICSLGGGHNSQINRRRRLKIHCLHQPSVRSDGNSALSSQTTSTEFNKCNLSSVKVWNWGFHILLWLNRCFAYRLASRRCSLWPASENHSCFASFQLMAGSFRQLCASLEEVKVQKQKHNLCIL